MGHFNEGGAAVGAGEGVFAFQELFALEGGLGHVELVAGNNGCFAGTAGQGVVVHARGISAR